MPKIKIIEHDNTGSEISGTSNKTVYVPGYSTASWNSKGPKLFKTKKDFIDNEIITELTLDTSCLSYRLAKHLLDLGFEVLYEGFTQGEITNGKVPSAAWERLLDKNNYNIRFLTTGGFSENASFTPDSEEVTCASKRGDCIALLDHARDLSASSVLYIVLNSMPSDWSVNYTSYYTKDYTFSGVTGGTAPEFELYTYYAPLPGTTPDLSNPDDFILLTQKPSNWDDDYANYYTTEINYSNVTGGSAPVFVTGKYYEKITSQSADQVAKVRNAFQGCTANGEYAAAFTPWFETKNSDLIDSSVDKTYIPAAFAYLFAYAQSVKNNPIWYAIAGSQRGIIPELSDVLYSYSNAECEMLQGRSSSEEVELDDESDNNAFAINPIAYIRPFGYILWGNRTLFYQGQALKSTSFLNVRNLITEIKKELFETARRFTFDQNGDVLWINFSNRVTPLLERMKSGNGVLAYRLDRVKTNKKARLAAKLSIVPIEGVEDFEFDIYLEDSLEVSETV